MGKHVIAIHFIINQGEKGVTDFKLPGGPALLLFR